MESPFNIKDLRKEIKKLFVDLDIEKRGSLNYLSSALSKRHGVNISRNSISMDLTGFRETKAYQDLLLKIREYLLDQIKTAA